jgi:hypothetical protein
MDQTCPALRRCRPALPSIPGLHPTERVNSALFRQHDRRAPPVRGHHVHSGETVMSINTARINRGIVIPTVGNWPDPMRKLG